MRNILSIDRFLSSVSLLLILITGDISANQTWERLYSKRSTDAFRSVSEAVTGGFIAVGYSADSLPNDTDAYVVRLDLAGDTIWTKSINGPLSRKDLFYKSCNLTNGFAMCGYSNSYDSSFIERAFLSRIDDSGTVIWSRTLPLAGRSRGQDVILTRDSCLAVAGYLVDANGFNGFIMKTDLNGDTLWSRRFVFSGSNFTDLNSLRELPGGGYVACGQCRIGNDFDIYLLVTDSLGNEIWSRNIGTDAADNAECVELTGNGFMICGSTDSTSSNSTTDGLLISTDSLGNILWTGVYGDSTLNDDFHQVSKTSNGDWLLSGTTRSFGPPLPNIWVLRVDTSGSVIWNRTFGGGNHDHGYSAIQTADGGFIAAGYASSFNFNYEDAYLIRMDSSGNLEDYLKYGTVAGIINPVGFTCADDSISLVVAIANMGRDTIYDFDVTAVLSGGVNRTVTWNYPGAIYPGDVVYDTCPSPIDLLGTNCTVDFDIVLDIENDVLPSRNTLSLRTTIIQPPVTTGAVRCGPGNVTLQAVNSCESILWFRQPQGGSIINAGNSFTVNAQEDTTLYVQSGSYCPRVPVTAVTRPLPLIDIVQGNDTITALLPYTLQAPSGYLSYVWSNFANSQNLTVNSPGLYCVTVIDTNGCAGSDCVVLNDSILTALSVPAENRIMIYPNPATDVLTVKLESECNTCSISILSYDGRILKEGNFEGSDHHIDLNGLASGVYFLNWNDDGVYRQIRFVKR